jgi:hypothetical protein
MNANTIVGLSPVNLVAQTINATAETALTQSIAGVASTINLPLSPNFNADGHPFVVRLIGKATGGTAATLQLALRIGSFTGTKFATFTVSGSAIPAAGGNFSLSANLIWDATSGVLNGTISGHTNNTVTTAGAITQVTGITSVAGLSFVPTATFGAALATNTVTITDFSIEQI